MRLRLDAPEGLVRVTAPDHAQYLIRAENKVIGKKTELLNAGRPFDLELHCRGDKLTISIDGRRVRGGNTGLAGLVGQDRIHA